MSRAFIDTNIVLYLVSSDGAKAARAEDLLREGVDCSVQLLSELTNVTRRKFGFGWDEVAALRGVIEMACTVHSVTMAIHLKAVEIARRDHLHIYDAQMVAAALVHGAPILWSEDLQHGRVFEDWLTIANPFLPAADVA